MCVCDWGNLGSMPTELAVNEYGRVFSGFCRGEVDQKAGNGLDGEGVFKGWWYHSSMVL